MPTLRLKDRACDGYFKLGSGPAFLPERRGLSAGSFSRTAAGNRAKAVNNLVFFDSEALPVTRQ